VEDPTSAVLTLGSGEAVNARKCPYRRGQGFESPQLHQEVRERVPRRHVEAHQLARTGGFNAPLGVEDINAFD